MYLLGGFDFEGMLFAENVGKWRNLKCILIRFFPQKILEIFTYSTKIMLYQAMYACTARESGKRINGAIWSKSY